MKHQKQIYEECDMKLKAKLRLCRTLIICTLHFFCGSTNNLISIKYHSIVILDGLINRNNNLV